MIPPAVTRVLAMLGLVLTHVLLSPASAGACGISYQNDGPSATEGCASAPSLVGAGTVAAAVAAATAARMLGHLAKGATAATDTTRAADAPTAGVSTPSLSAQTLPASVNSYAQFLQARTPALAAMRQRAISVGQAGGQAATHAQAAAAAALRGDEVQVRQAAGVAATLLRSTAEAATVAAQAAQAYARTVHQAVGDPKNRKPRSALERAALDAAVRATGAAEQVHTQAAVADRVSADLANARTGEQVMALTTELATAAEAAADAANQVTDATTTTAVLATHTEAGAQGVAVPELGIDTYVPGDLTTLQSTRLVRETVLIPGLANPWGNADWKTVELGIGGNLDRLMTNAGIDLPYPVFDRWDVDSRTATSIKTIDWRRFDPPITTNGQRYLNEISQFQAGIDQGRWTFGPYAETPSDLVLRPGDIDHYVLAIAFPAGTPEQVPSAAILEKYVEIARRAVLANSGVLVQLIPIGEPDATL